MTSNDKPNSQSSVEESSPAKTVHPPSLNANNASSHNNSNNNKKGSTNRSNLNRTPLRSRIPQAVSTPPSSRVTSATTTTIKNGNSGAAVSPTSMANSSNSLNRVGRPVANNKTTGLVAPKVVKSTTTAGISAVRHHNSGSSMVSHRVSPTKAATPSSNQPTSGDSKVAGPTSTTTASSSSSSSFCSSSSNLLKSVKPGLPVSSSPLTSKIPRPSSGAQHQTKSSPSAQSARPLTATSSARHPSSSSLLPRTTVVAAAMVGVKPSSSPLHKSTSRLHLTHNKGESSLRSDLVSAH